MDYTTHGLSFRVKKLLRYIRLYGPGRTLVKVRGQYHAKKKYDQLPVTPGKNAKGGHVGLIGCGNFQYSNIAYYLKKNFEQVMRASMDVDINRAASLFEEYGLAYYTDDAQDIISDPSIDLIFIASNHASHTEYAIDALNAGKDVHIEKPHCVTEDQLRRLLNASAESSGRILSVGYNRPVSKIGLSIKHHLEGQSGAAMLNWFVAGHELDPDHWYFHEAEGGRILGNLCHWTDFTYNLIDPDARYPLKIIPTRSAKSDCDVAVTYVFGDGSVGAITFSAKGHTFEGVKEKFAAHKGNVLIYMEDFKNMVIENMDRKIKHWQLYRDHGHEESICNSYRTAQDSECPGLSPEYIWESAQLFLATREALERNEIVEIRGFNDYVSK